MLYIHVEILYHHLLIYTQVRDVIMLDEKGQTLVEFILLLSVLMLTSLIFLSTVNSGTAALWQAAAKILVEDPTVAIILR